MDACEEELAISALELQEAASEFAAKLNARVEGVLPEEQPQFGAVVLPGRKPRLLVAPADSGDPDQITKPLVLTVPGRLKPRQLHLRAVLYCCPDTSNTYLTIEESQFSLGLAGVTDPLFRYEYDRGVRGKNRLPAAHLQVHAHRDETTYLMVHADDGRPKQRWRKQRVPRLSEFHFPVGGDRFRPCLEDVIWIAANELGAKIRHGGWKALEEGRAEWRRLQLAAAVRDAPEIAADALRNEGWTVTIDDSDAGERTEKLIQP